jgi:hypothetical protein
VLHVENGGTSSRAEYVGANSPNVQQCGRISVSQHWRVHPAPSGLPHTFPEEH